MARLSNIEEIVLTDEESSLRHCHNTSSLSYGINAFSGDSYNHSIREAFEWMKSVNNNPLDSRLVELDCYFKQLHKEKSILVSYKTKVKKGHIA